MSDELRGLRTLVLSGPADPPSLRRLLRRALDRGATAVRHPLGFACVPLFRSTAAGLCLHVWADGIPAPELTTSPVHAHTWDLTSRVLCGVVRNDLVDVELDPGENGARARAPTHGVFTVHSRGRVDEIRRTGRRAACRDGSVDVVAAGQTYVLPSGRFHATRTARPTATLVLAVTRRPPPELVLGPLTGRTHRVTRNTCSADQLRVIADVVDMGGR